MQPWKLKESFRVGISLVTAHSVRACKPVAISAELPKIMLIPIRSPNVQADVPGGAKMMLGVTNRHRTVRSEFPLLPSLHRGYMPRKLLDI
jgi:hypothetical protein